jgi:undecaprenyl-diphosphatase
MHTIFTTDLRVFYSLHGLAGKSALGDSLIIFFAKYYIFVLFGSMVGFIYKDYYLSPRRKFLLGTVSVILTIGGSYVVAQVIHYFYHHLRPLFALPIQHLLNESSYSFPSGHTIIIFGMATAALAYSKRLAYFLYASGLVVGVARVMAGVHYPLDILGGIILGIATGLVVQGWAKYITRKTNKALQ